MGKYYFFVSFFFLFSFKAMGANQSSQITSGKFNQIFTTAAYSTALGGAVGTAVLAFTPRPAENFKFIAIGASIGFLSGILLGGYLAFVPSFNKKSSSGALSSEGGLGSQIRSDTFTVETSFDEGRVETVALHFPVLKL